MSILNKHLPQWLTLNLLPILPQFRTSQPTKVIPAPSTHSPLPSLQKNLIPCSQSQIPTMAHQRLRKLLHLMPRRYAISLQKWQRKLLLLKRRRGQNRHRSPSIRDQVPDIPDVDMDGDEEEGEGEEGWEKVEKGDEDENGDEDEDDLPTPTATIRRVVEPKIDVKGKGKAKEVEDDGEPGGWEPEFGSAGTSYGAFAGYPQEPGRAPENIQILTSQIMHSPLQTDNLWLKPEPEPFPELVHTTSPPPLPLKDFPSFIPASTSHNKPNKLVKPEKFPSDSNWLDNILHIGRKKAKKAKGNAKSVGSAVLPVTAIADAFVHPSASSSRYGRDPNKSQSSLDIELSHPHTRTLSNNSLTGRRVVDMGVDLERERATADAATTWKEAMRQQEQQERVRQRRGRGRGWGGDEDEDEDADRSPPPTFSQIYPDGSPVEIPSESTPDLGDTKGGYPQANVGDEKGVNEDYASDEDDGDDLYEPVRGEGEDENDKDPGLLPDSKSNSNTDSTSTLPVTGAGATSPYQFPEPSIPPIPTIPTIPTIPSESSQASPQIAMPIPTMPAIFPWAASASQLLSSSSPSPALVPTPLAPAPPATQPEIPGNGLGPEPEPESVAPDAANAPFAIAVEAPLPPSPPLLFTLDTNGEPAPLSDPFPPELLSTAPATTDPAPDPDRPISSYSSQPSDPDEDSDDGEAEAIPANDAPTSATTPAFSPTDRRLAHLARIRTQISELKKTLSVLEGEEKSAFKTWGGAGKLGSEVVLKLQKAAEVEDVKRKIEKLERKRERVAFAAHNPDQEGNPNTINLNDLSPEAAAEKMRERIQKLMGGERTRDGKEESGEVLNKGSAYELNSDSLEKLMKEEEIEEKKSPSLPSAPSVPQFTHLEVVTPQSIKFRTVKTEVLRVLNKFQFDYNESENSSSVIRVRIPVTATNPSSSPVLQKSGSFSDEGKKKEGDS
ncbi:hypothetical protein GYMLUDRAFT_639699 [Collybiopsis luxurians FD-317 M1]|nr:hypothetical protein GYMLUDRAFT_639699 [Collybiopsis luxurians FD-317 M1]